jgi:secondary thiamine-phosphate synthase enzyme
MTVINSSIHITTRGDCEIVDITRDVADEIRNSHVVNGIATLFISGSTAGISTIEYEEGLLDDFKTMWQRTVPQGIQYQHDRRWHDGNGHSHVRASMLGPSLVVPFANKTMMLGTWQQIIVVDFDNRPRSREIVVQVIGE